MPRSGIGLNELLAIIARIYKVKWRLRGPREAESRVDLQWCV